MTQFASPVLHSLLDTDAYKLHMQQAVFHHYYDVHGEYPDEVLLDTLYRTRENIGMCANLGIRVSGPRLGRKPKHVDPAQRRQDQDAENRRGEIER